MFARTERLLLRPGWAEDAPALAAAIADEMIVRNLATAPWPYRLRDAEAFLAQPRDPVLPSFLIFERTDGAPN
ncbi:MAG TPA: GNAT family N-acetyltransferase, partial [bacterium]|nr:GNAT family N-acetyltransferase [bacterium]